jgi:hypothetical protein
MERWWKMELIGQCPSCGYRVDSACSECPRCDYSSWWIKTGESGEKSAKFECPICHNDNTSQPCFACKSRRYFVETLKWYEWEDIRNGKKYLSTSNTGLSDLHPNKTFLGIYPVIKWL